MGISFAPLYLWVFFAKAGNSLLLPQCLPNLPNTLGRVNLRTLQKALKIYLKFYAITFACCLGLDSFILLRNLFLDYHLCSWCLFNYSWEKKQKTFVSLSVLGIFFNFYILWNNYFIRSKHVVIILYYLLVSSIRGYDI